MSLELVRIGERRREDRVSVEIPVRIWGIDVRGERFLQDARAREISFCGGLLSQLETDLRSGDVIGVLYQGKKARYRVIWVRHSGGEQKIQAAIQRLERDECPWADLLPKSARAASIGSTK